MRGSFKSEPDAKLSDADFHQIEEELNIKINSESRNEIQDCINRCLLVRYLSDGEKELPIIRKELIQHLENLEAFLSFFKQKDKKFSPAYREFMRFKRRYAPENNNEHGLNKLSTAPLSQYKKHLNNFISYCDTAKLIDHRPSDISLNQFLIDLLPVKEKIIKDNDRKTLGRARFAEAILKIIKKEFRPHYHSLDAIEQRYKRLIQK